MGADSESRLLLRRRGLYGARGGPTAAVALRGLGDVHGHCRSPRARRSPRRPRPGGPVGGRRTKRHPHASARRRTGPKRRRSPRPAARGPGRRTTPHRHRTRLHRDRDQAQPACHRSAPEGRAPARRLSAPAPERDRPALRRDPHRWRRLAAVLPRVRRRVARDLELPSTSA